MKRVLIASDIINLNDCSVFPRLKSLGKNRGICFSICETSVSEIMKSFSDKNDFEKFSEIRSQLIDLGVERVLKHIGEPLLRDFSGDIVKEEFVPWDVVKSQMSDSFCGDIYENFSRKRNRAYDAKKQFTSEELGRSLEKFLKEDFSNKWYPEEMLGRKIFTVEEYFDAIVNLWWYDTVVECSLIFKRVKDEFESGPLSIEMLSDLKRKIIEEDRLNSKLSEKIWNEERALFEDVSSCKPVSVYYRSLRSLVRQILSAKSVRSAEKKNLINLPEYMVQMRNMNVLLTDNRGIVRTMFNEVFSKIPEKRIMTLSELEVEMAK